jgi:hypothetical protein
MSFFQQSILRKHIATNADKISKAYKLHANYFHDSTIQENIRNSKEEQFQEGFFRELFVKILGYTLNPVPNFNLITERKNEKDSKKTDAAILVSGEVVGVTPQTGQYLIVSSCPSVSSVETTTSQSRLDEKKNCSF